MDRRAICKRAVNKIKIHRSGSCLVAALCLTKAYIQKGMMNFSIVEGYAYHNSGGPRLQHTWIEFDDGEVIDPTHVQFNHFPNKMKNRGFIKKRYTPMEYTNISMIDPCSQKFVRFNLKEKHANESRIERCRH